MRYSASASTCSASFSSLRLRWDLHSGPFAVIDQVSPHNSCLACYLCIFGKPQRFCYAGAFFHLLNRLVHTCHIVSLHSVPKKPRTPARKKTANKIIAAAPFLFTFPLHPGTKPINNRTEREPRPLVLRRKIIGQIGGVDVIRKFGAVRACRPGASGRSILTASWNAFCCCKHDSFLVETRTGRRHARLLYWNAYG